MSACNDDGGDAAAAAAAAGGAAPQQQHAQQQRQRAPLPPLPRDVLAHIFSLLPRDVRHVTPGRVCRAWREAAPLGRQAGRAREDAQRVSPWGPPWLPLWYVKEAFASVGPTSRRAIRDGALYYGQLDAARHLLAVYGDFFESPFHVWRDALERRPGRARAEPPGVPPFSPDDQFALLELLFEHGCPFVSDGIVDGPAMCGRLPLVRWLVERGCPWHPERVCALASHSDCVDILKWVVEERRVPLDLSRCVRILGMTCERERWLAAAIMAARRRAV